MPQIYMEEIMFFTSSHFGLKNMPLLCIMNLKIREKKKIKKKSSSILKSIQNFKKIVNGILCFYKHMPEKLEYPTEILVWQLYICEIGKGEINIFVHKKIEKD